MTNMNMYQNDTFDQIYDKGALDALMSTNTNDTKVIMSLLLLPTLTLLSLRLKR